MNSAGASQLFGVRLLHVKAVARTRVGSELRPQFVNLPAFADSLPEMPHARYHTTRGRRGNTRSRSRAHRVRTKLEYRTLRGRFARSARLGGVFSHVGAALALFASTVAQRSPILHLSKPEAVAKRISRSRQVPQLRFAFRIEKVQLLSVVRKMA